MKIKSKSQIANVQPEPKLPSDMLPIAPIPQKKRDRLSGPTVGDTLVQSTTVYPKLTPALINRE